ncbi:23S rRNA (uracil(1939)-C(5))-methyltransferase RlmD [Marinomonas sp. A79]|uniref:23S rRNA (uracil(1939)-C(5))-methyltransferase RlmD n=1 Tax=Marinomonas vulgaris TaxID=2823372 RepID=A0ABS5H7F0_9GAMM|nr:23S rRNA (uracil(1939)-C(5))-methyltransferase RlmD [Marinomonas vulgaris]MBR7887370.1 23S rRNA (uracil(1939)-C(5))-methyltransferase RlmD [Marinomonas vulgaris]
MRRRISQRRAVKPQPIGPVQTYQVEGLTHEAKGVARLQGKVTFIEGALPGETVDAQVTKSGRRFDEATMTRLLEPSPYRVDPPCPHFTRCGGCSFQHLADEKQLSAKRDWLQGQLRNLMGTHTLETLSDTSTAYRRRARLSVNMVKGEVVLGFRGKASNDIISIDHCVVLTKPLQTVFLALKTALAGDPLAPNVGHIELLEDTKGVSVLVRLTSVISDELEKQWQDWAHEAKIALYWQAPKLSRAELASQEMRYYEVNNGEDKLRLQYHPQDFIQVNAAMNQKMLDQAMAWLAPQFDDVVLDLFCGVGNFSLPLARSAKSVIGVEVQDSMVASAQSNAEMNGVDNATFIAADLTQPAALETTASTLLTAGVTKILLDPPRAGALEFLDSIIKIAPAQILYVSCNASTLARDAEYLVAKGYRVMRVGLMDMFPQTSHVETMMLLHKKT